MRVLLRDHELRVVTLGMQRVGGDDGAGQVQGRQERRELGYLVRLAVHRRLGEHRPGLLIKSGQQVHRLPADGRVPVPRTALPSTATARR